MVEVSLLTPHFCVIVVIVMMMMMMMQITGKDSGYEGNKSLLFISIIFCDKDSF